MKLFKIVLFSVIASLSLTSCLDSDEDSENTYTAYGFYTITGSFTSGYTLYSDTGGKVIPTSSSVADLTNSTGFGSHNRALFYFKYKESQVTADGKSITGAELYDGRYLDELNPMSLQVANETLVTAEDSIFQITEFMDTWAYRGYLNTVVNGPYSTINGVAIKPTVNLVYDPSSIAENAITFNIYYNRHSDKTAPSNGPTYFYSSYFLNDLDSMIPGSDKVKITIKSPDGVVKEVSVSRENFHKGNYE